MAYARRGSRRFGRKRRVFRRRRLPLRRRVARLSRRVRAMRPEVKIRDAIVNVAAMQNAGGDIAFAELVAIGTGVGNRIGDKLTQKALWINVMLTLDGAVASSENVRLVVYILKDNSNYILNSASARIGDLFEPATINTTTAPMANTQWATKGNYHILVDENVQVSAAAASTVVISNARPWRKLIRIPARYSQLQFNAGTVEPIKNAIYFTYICNIDNAVIMTGQTRYYYTDS